MILSIQIPELGMGIRRARVSDWMVSEGGEISFGDVVCVLKVRQWEMAGRTKDATRLTKLRRKQREQPTGSIKMRCPTCGHSEDLAVELACPDCLRFQVMASESGVLSSVLAKAGEEVTIGDVVALASIDGDDTPSDSTNEHPKMRIVVDLIDRAEGDL